MTTISPLNEDTTPQKLTPEDPIDADSLKRLEELQTLRLQLAERVLDLEQEKIRTLRAASNVDAERQRLFESVLISRGLPPSHPVTIDAKTGTLTLLAPVPEPAPAATAAA